jgi:hypothetical protein
MDKLSVVVMFLYLRARLGDPYKNFTWVRIILACKYHISQKLLKMTNTLAYHDTELFTALKSIMEQALGPVL